MGFSHDAETHRALQVKHYRSVKGYSLVLAATAIWSGNFIAARILANSVPPVTLVVLRSAIAIVVLLPFVIRSLRAEIRVIRKHLGYLTLTAFLGMCVCNTVVYIAAATSPAVNLTLIAICSPIFTVLFARFFLRDTLTFRRIIGLVVATSGVVFLITGGQPSRLAHLTFSEGDLWMLSQAASFALYSILVRKRPAELHPLDISLFLVRPGPAIVAAVVRLGTVWNSRDRILSHGCGGDSLSRYRPVAIGLSVLERIGCNHWPYKSGVCLLLPPPV